MLDVCEKGSSEDLEDETLPFWNVTELAWPVLALVKEGASDEECYATFHDCC